MNIRKIKEICNIATLTDEAKEFLIISIIAQDKEVIPTIMKILAEERKQNTELTKDMNVLLSKADVGLSTPELNKDAFMQKEIKEFYIKYKDKVGHCFKNEDYTKEDKEESEGLV